MGEMERIWSASVRLRMRVVLVGDSHLTDTSPRRRVTKLGPRLRRTGLDVISVAVGGANSRDLLGQQIPGGADWVVYSVGINDAAPWKCVPLEEFAANCDRIMADTHPARRLVLGPGPVADRGAPGERTNVVVAAYAAVLERVALSHSARFVSMVDLLDVNDLAEDGVHLNDSGYRKLTRRVLRDIDVRPG